MSSKKRAYLFHTDVKLTKHVKKRIKKLLEEAALEQANENICGNLVDFEEILNEAKPSSEVTKQELERTTEIDFTAGNYPSNVELDAYASQEIDQTSSTRQLLLTDNVTIDAQKVLPQSTDQVIGANFLQQVTCQDLLIDTDSITLDVHGVMRQSNDEIGANFVEQGTCTNSLINDQDNEYFQSPWLEYLSDSDNEEMLRLLLSDNRVSRNIQDLNSESFLQSIGNTIDKSPGELLLMTLRFSLHNQLSFSSLTNLLQFVNCICGAEVLPDTRYKLNDLLNYNESVTLHSICPTCTKYLGTFNDTIKCVVCSECNTKVTVSNPSDPCFFALIDISSAISEYIHQHENYYDYIMYDRIHERNSIKDIYDGKAYRTFVKSLKDDVRHAYVTATLNTDGAPTFKSSNFSIWPIYLMINEIPVQARFDSLIVAGMWFGKSKPEMSAILEQFVPHLNKYSTTGVTCKIKNVDRIVKVFVTVSCVDTIARATMNGTMQFNAHYGCDWCEHPGVYFAGSMRYPYLEIPAQPRSKNSTIEYAHQAIENNHPVCGVKSASPLLNLKKFDIIDSFTPDYMHCLLAGVTYQITDALLESLSQAEIDQINKLLLQIKLPTQVGRLTREIKDRNFWKCREWENWLLYCSLPVLSTVIENKFLKHWCLLLDSTFILLQTNITYDELNNVNVLINSFVKGVKQLYSLKMMTYNVHQMLHIVKSVENWGPLWAHSAFSFESANHKLLCAIKCAKGVLLQIIRYINIERFVTGLERIVFPNCSDTFTQYYNSINSLKVKNMFKLSSITYLGKENIIDEYSLLHFQVSKTTKVFSKMILHNCMFSSYKKVNERSCNSFAKLANGTFIRIIDFLVDVENNLELTTCHTLSTISNRHSSVIKEISTIQTDIVCISTNEIETICVFIEINNCKYIIPVPNLYHY